MKKYLRWMYRMNNATDGATSSIKWGKKPGKKYGSCAGKGGCTCNFEMKDTDRKENA